MSESRNRVLTYDWNGHKDMPMSAPHLSDFEVAVKVRMLMRTDLDHETICTMARDRIMALSKEVARLETGIAQLKDSFEAMSKGMRK